MKYIYLDNIFLVRNKPRLHPGICNCGAPLDCDLHSSIGYALSDIFLPQHTSPTPQFMS